MPPLTMVHSNNSNTLMNSALPLPGSKKLPLHNTKDVDIMLANELNQLSIQERENIYEEIHGVDPVVEESEPMIQQALHQLVLAIDRIPIKRAYNMALHHVDANRRDYVTSRKFRLMFLRSENFHVEKAAVRIILYMEGMLEYFGPHVLGRPLLYSDLSQDTHDYLKTGVHQLIHQARDSAGRAIFIDHYLKAEKITKSAAALVQAHVFLMYCAVENDELTQQRGVVIVSYIIGQMSGGFDSHAYAKLCDIQNWLPIKFPAIHICFDSPMWHVWAPLAWLVMGRELRRRVRIHDGTHIECMYAMQGFGIPVNQLPVNYQGELKNANHYKWLSKQRAKAESMIYQQQQTQQLQSSISGGHHNRPTNTNTPSTIIPNKNSTTSSTTTIDVPSRNDVILWRGRVYQLHPGNVRMRTLIEEHKEEYDRAQKGQKGMIAMKIVSTIKNHESGGGRFLTQNDGGWWVEVSEKEAQRRVSKSFRSARSATSSNTKTSSVVIAAAAVGVGGNKRLRIDPGMESDASGGSTGNCCTTMYANCMLPSSSRRKDRNILM